MKVLLINGSPNRLGCTNMALNLVSEELEKAGVGTQILWLGNKPLSGCIACRRCKSEHPGRCALDSDVVNEALELAKDSDGFVFGSPVHYAAATGAISCFLDRLFYAGASSLFAHKPGAVLASCRRSGGTATIEQLNKYLTISQMPMVSSNYWNVVHGSKAEDVLLDLEGVDIMRTLGKNMAYMLKCIEAGRAAGVLPPENAPRAIMNFIR